MTEIEQLIEPLAGADPCGVEPEADSRFEAIRSLIESGTEETPPDWKKVRKQAVELLNDGRSVELLVILTVAMTAVNGYKGMRDGLFVLSRSVIDFWDDIHPKLDESEQEDERYIIRLNTLAQLGEPPRKLGDPLGFIEKVFRTPMSPSGSRGAPVFWDVWEAQQRDASVPEQARDALMRLDAAEREGLSALVAESIQALRDLNSFLIEKTGAAYNAPFDEHLLPALDGISKFVSSVGGVAAAADDAPEAAADDAAAPAPAAPAAQSGGTPGEIRSSNDVRRALDKIIEYYRKSEPSSPVPYLLLRAKKLVDADFIAIVSNLNKESEFQFKTTLDINESEE